MPILLGTPAARRFLSVEPMLGPVDLRLVEYVNEECRGCSGLLSPAHEPGNHMAPGEWHGVDWCICGGESGPGARPMHTQWARDLRDQCVAAGVAFHFKQFGEWARGGPGVGTLTDPRQTYGSPVDSPSEKHADLPWREVLTRTGKKAAGRVLDGRTWDEYPDPVLSS